MTLTPAEQQRIAEIQQRDNIGQSLANAGSPMVAFAKGAPRVADLPYLLAVIARLTQQEET